MRLLKFEQGLSVPVSRQIDGPIPLPKRPLSAARIALALAGDQNMKSTSPSGRGSRWRYSLWRSLLMSRRHLCAQPERSSPPRRTVPESDGGLEVNCKRAPRAGKE